MIYRRSPPQPPRALLRIVTTAGAGAMIGIAACSSTGATRPSQFADAASRETGSGEDASNPCAMGCGFVGGLFDSGGLIDMDAEPDASEITDSKAPRDANDASEEDIVIGVVVHPDAGEAGAD